LKAIAQPQPKEDQLAVAYQGLLKASNDPITAGLV
jgi:hypothetical protein